eukprot:scaffold220_cov169-Amphora_coffeaeformis.AAC.23
MANKKKKPQAASADATSMADFVTALAAQSAAGGAISSVPSKAERIAKRQAKRKRKQEEQQQKQQLQKKRKEDTKQQAPTSSRQQSKHRQERFLHQWRADLAALVEAHSESKPRYLIKIVETSDRKPRNFPHTVHHKKMKTSLEPRKCDYGGLGLARPTLYLPFSDPSWLPRLEQAFAEHVPGWSGKPPMMQAMKKQRDANLLWRRLQREKQQVVSGNHKGRPMTPDERVEAMLQSGDLV